MSDKENTPDHADLPPSTPTSNKEESLFETSSKGTSPERRTTSKQNVPVPATTVGTTELASTSHVASKPTSHVASEEEEEEYDEGEEEYSTKITQLEKRYEGLKDRLRKMQETVWESYTEQVHEPFMPGSTPFSKEIGADGASRCYLFNSDLGTICLAVDMELLLGHVEKEWDEDDGDLTDVIQKNDEQKPPRDKRRLIKDACFDKRKKWFNFLSNTDIEIECYEEGLGRRSQVIPNSGKSYHLGALSSVGFILGRSGAYSRHSSTEDKRYDKNISDWFPSVIEFRPYHVELGSLQKATWTHHLPMGESAILLGCSTTHVCVVSDAPQSTIRLYSLSGTLHYIAVLSYGAPITLNLRDNIIIVAELASNTPCPPSGFEPATIGNTPWTQNETNANFNLWFDNEHRQFQKHYYVTVLAIRPSISGITIATVHHLNTTRLCVSGRRNQLIWVGLTPTYQPVVVTKHDVCMVQCIGATSNGYVATEMRHLSHDAQSNAPLPSIEGYRIRQSEAFLPSWVITINNMQEALGFERSSSKSTSLYPIGADTGSLNVLVCSNKESLPSIPAPGEMKNRRWSIPFRLPMTAPVGVLDDGGFPMSASRWRDYIMLDPGLTEKKENIAKGNFTGLPWQIWDEIRLRRIMLDLNQAVYLKTAGLLASGTIRQQRVSVEVATLKEILKMINDVNLEAAFALSEHLALDQSLCQVIDAIADRGADGRAFIRKVNEVIRAARRTDDSVSIPASSPTELSTETTEAVVKRNDDVSSGMISGLNLKTMLQMASAKREGSGTVFGKPIFSSASSGVDGEDVGRKKRLRHDGDV